MTIKSNRLCKEVMDIDAHSEFLHLELANKLYLIRSKELYKPRWDTFSDFLGELTTISASRASRLANVYKRFVVDFNFSMEELAEVGWSNLSEIIPRCTTRAQAEKWLTYARSHGRNDIRNK